MAQKILATAALAAVLAAPAWAAEHAKMDKQSNTPMNQLPLAESSLISDSDVNDPNGNKIASVESMVIDVKSGRVAYAILSANGKDVAVPWQRLHAGSSPKTFVIDTDKQALDNAPQVDRSNLAQLRDPQERQKLSAFWDKIPAQQQAQTPEEGRKSR